MKFYEAIKAMMEDGRIVQNDLNGATYRYHAKTFERFCVSDRMWVEIDGLEYLSEETFHIYEEPKPVKRVPVVAVKTNLKAYEHDPFYIRLDRELKSGEEKFPLKFDPATGECYVEIQE